MRNRKNRKVVMVVPVLALLLMAASCGQQSIDNSIKAAASVASVNRAASDLADTELAAGRIDQPTRDTATLVFKEVAHLDNAVLDTLEAARTAGFLSTASRQTIVNSVNLMRLRISAGAFPFIQNEQSRVSIAEKIQAATNGLDALLSVLPAGK